MLLPITHENMSARRWPIVTIVLIAACLVSLLVLQLAMREHRARVRAATIEVVDYARARPYLRLPRALESVQERASSAPDDDSLDERSRTARDSDVVAEQAELDSKVAALVALAQDSPVRRYGYVPADGFGRGLVTSQFLHGGWLHLLGNMWFLWLCGCNLEDRWGRRVFLPFYVSAGIVAALAHKIAAGPSAVPLVGASGAIAGAMGAFLVLFATTRIRFFYLFFMRWGTFWAPAFVMLPLWLVEQLAWGMLAPADKGGVAYWAHVGGFAYGIAFALVLRASGIDVKLDAAVENAVSTTQDPRVIRAGELIDSGNALAGLAMLDSVAGEKPRDIDVQLEILRGAKAASDAWRQTRAYARLVSLYLENGMADTAADLLAEARNVGMDSAISEDLRQAIQPHRRIGVR